MSKIFIFLIILILGFGFLFLLKDMVEKAKIKTESLLSLFTTITNLTLGLKLAGDFLVLSADFVGRRRLRRPKAEARRAKADLISFLIPEQIQKPCSVIWKKWK